MSEVEEIIKKYSEYVAAKVDLKELYRESKYRSMLSGSEYSEGYLDGLDHALSIIEGTLKKEELK